MRDIYKDILTPLGYTAITAEGATAGIKTFRKRQDIGVAIRAALSKKEVTQT